MHVTDVAELDGLSDDAIAAAAEAATQRGLDGYLVELILPTHQPVLTSLRHRELRRRVLAASTGRGARTPTPTPATSFARWWSRGPGGLCCSATRPTATTCSPTVRSGPTPGSTRRCSSSSRPPSRTPIATRHGLTAALAADTGDRDFGAHDWAYYAERVDAAVALRRRRRGRGRGTGDAAVLRPLLRAHPGRGGRRLRGRRCGLRADLPPPHRSGRLPPGRRRSTRSLDAVEATPSGCSSATTTPAPGKQGGAWMESLVTQSRLLEPAAGGGQQPQPGQAAGRAADAAEHGRDPHPVP